MPRIGMRIVKSSAAVFLCFVIYLLRGKQGIPFYVAIAAVLCMQPYVTDSVRVAINRILATMLGGFAGIAVLLFEKAFVPVEADLIRYGIVSLCIIPLIYITVLIQKPAAAYITCVVFLCVTVSHGADIHPAEFAFNRMLDTCIGIMVSLGVNIIHIPWPIKKDVLFVSGLDGVLLQSDEKLSNYSKIKLNQLLSDGAKITIASARTPATLNQMLKDVHFTLPLIVMNGAAMYHLPTQTYLSCKYIPRYAVEEVLSVCREAGVNCFVHSVIFDQLFIYFSNINNSGEKALYQRMRGMPQKNYVYGELPKGQEALYLRIVEKPEKIQELSQKIGELSCAKELSITVTQDSHSLDCNNIEITSIQASKWIAAQELLEQSNAKYLAVFGKRIEDREMLAHAKECYIIKDCADKDATAFQGKMVESGDCVVRQISARFHEMPWNKKGHKKRGTGK